MPHHAIDISLTRPATPAEIKTAARAGRYPLAADATRTRLLALVPAKAPRRALRKLRGALDGLLPVDTLSTLYPDATGEHLLNVELNPKAHKALRRAAADMGSAPRTTSRTRCSTRWPATAPPPGPGSTPPWTASWPARRPPSSWAL